MKGRGKEGRSMETETVPLSWLESKGTRVKKKGGIGIDSQ